MDLPGKNAKQAMNLVYGRFGTVAKAAFAIGKKQNDDGTWDFEDPVYVLLNPSELRVKSSTSVKKEEGVANEATAASQNADGKLTPKGITEQTVEMKLIFNVVEAYNAKVEGGDLNALYTAAKSMITSAINKSFIDDAEDTLAKLVEDTDFTEFSLLNSEMCCYTPLLMAAHKQVPVIFYWGNIVYYGIITTFQTTFNYFSNQGAPLGAEVVLSLLSGVNDETEKVSTSTKALLGLIEEGGRWIRELPG